MPQILKLSMPAVRHWVTRHVSRHPRDLAAALATEFRVTRAAVAPVLHRLEGEAFISRVRGGTRPEFAQGPSRYLVSNHKLPGLDESAVWETELAPHLELPPNVANIIHYGVTEMVNNANDHSSGTQLTLRCAVAASMVYLWVLDDGEGLFEHMRRVLELPDRRLAVLELSKGRVTTDPARHTGEGIFFTSRTFSRFRIRANGLSYERRNRELDPAQPARQLPVIGLPDDDKPDEHLRGTRVTMALHTETSAQLREVFARYTTRAPDDLSFDRTVVPVRLARIGQEQLLSRSQAKRLLSGLDRFRRIELDFETIAEIGQAFADEVFRVWARDHPAIELLALNTNPQVAAMVRRVSGQPPT